MRGTFPIAVTFVLVLAAMIAAPTPAALAAELNCPSGGTPPPGSTVDGGLDVDGVCIIDGVTVNGGVTVEPGGHLQLTSSTVNGGILVLPCGELDVNATTGAFGVGAGVPTGTISTINGGIDLEGEPEGGCSTGASSDVDIWTAQIEGGITMTGTYEAFPVICGNDIRGSVHVNNFFTLPLKQAKAIDEAQIGDPDGFFVCPGNTISGSLHVSNSSGLLAVESNSVGGSVLLDASAVELNGNTIGGSLRCTNGAVIVPGEPTDPSGNTVHGKNTC